MNTPGEIRDQEATEAGRVGDGEAEPARAPDDLPQGARLGRYVVLRMLGAGAMGSVYQCYDPELDRRVALKLLRGASSPANRRALLREAQAMAKLTHPNVVTVHDVGENAGRVHVAMEFVDGGTLRQWLSEQRRPWRAVLEMFVQAGRGLQAAHDRELIHRDFKPDNVMVSRDGVARVMDFGLARPKTGTSDSDGDDSSKSNSLLTEATVGRAAGTPAYMAPEQMLALVLTPAADQFAFCVSLWEALCGQRPFEGKTSAQRFANTQQGNIGSVSPDAQMPRWLRRVLVRGLRAKASARWPSMTALLAQLERGRQRWRRQLAVAVVVAVAVPVGLSAASEQQQARERRARVVACEAEGSPVDEIWNDRQRLRLETGLLGTGVGFARRSVDTLIPWLDAYRHEWSSGRVEACMHHQVDGDWDEVLLARSAWCFEDRRLAFEATVDQIATGDVSAARRAVRLASYLEPIGKCLDPTLLERLPIPPPHMQAETRAIRMALIQVDRLRHAGRYDEAYEAARDARGRAETLGWPPTVAAARFLEGRSLLEAGRLVEADSALTTAYFEAQRTASFEVAFRAARSMIGTASSMGRYHAAEVWARHAELLSADLDDPSGLDEAEGHHLLARVYRGQRLYERAAKEGELAVQMRTEALGPDHPITAASVGSLGLVRLKQGRAAAALELLERSYTVWLDSVGRSHPRCGRVAGWRGSALLALGRTEEAVVWLLEALEVLEGAHGDDHIVLADTLEELGRGYVGVGRSADAEQVRARAAKIRNKASQG